MYTIALIILIIVIFWLIASYNAFVKKRNRVHNAWSDIDVQLKRRYDLVPNLVQTVKGYKDYEANVLEEVTRARTGAMQAGQGNGLAMRAQAEMGLSNALTNLFAVAENYPQLKASENFKQLQEQLSSLENDIQSARRYYNATVRELNNSIQAFPTNLVAALFRFKQADFFGVDESQRDVVKVSI